MTAQPARWGVPDWILGSISKKEVVGSGPCPLIRELTFSTVDLSLLVPQFPRPVPFAPHSLHFPYFPLFSHPLFLFGPAKKSKTSLRFAARQDGREAEVRRCAEPRAQNNEPQGPATHIADEEWCFQASRCLVVASPLCALGHALGGTRRRQSHSARTYGVFIQL